MMTIVRAPQPKVRTRMRSWDIKAKVLGDVQRCCVSTVMRLNEDGDGEEWRRSSVM